MSALDIFTYANHQVRTVVIDGEAWFIGRDACEVIGITKYRDAIAQLDADERVSVAVDTLGGTQMMTAVNEAGLYALMFISRSPKVRDFQRWVTHEVLPSIRKTGQFGTALPTNFAEALELAAAEIRKSEALEAKVAADAPKVEAWERLMDSEGFYSFEAAGKILGVGRNTLFGKLRDAGVIQRGSRMPYQRYMHHFKITTGTRPDRNGDEVPTATTRIRPSGIPFIVSKLDMTLAVSL